MEGKGLGQIYKIDRTLNIARNKANDIFLEDFATSRKHASITVVSGAGTYFLEGPGSVNGTSVNSQKLKQYDRYALRDGDLIRIGLTVFVFVLTDE